MPYQVCFANIDEFVKLERRKKLKHVIMFVMIIAEKNACGHKSVRSANKTISVVDELLQTYDVMQIKLQNII